VPWEIVTLVSSSDDGAGMYTALHTTLDTHDALNLLDIQEVANSWKHAALWNSSE